MFIKKQTNNKMRKKSSSPPQINFQKDNSFSIKDIHVLGWQVGLTRKAKIDNKKIFCKL